MKNETKNSTNMILIVGIGVVALGMGFFGGMQYQKTQTRAAFGQGRGNGQFAGASGFGGPRGNGTNRPVTGTILNQDDKSITVQLQDGSSKIVLITGSTTINKADSATKSDLTTGMKVAAFGTTNADGSITAQNVQLNPVMRVQNGIENQTTPSGIPTSNEK